MAARVRGVVLLLGLATVSLPVHAQDVDLRVCNAGTVDVDVFVSRAGKISSTHIGAADCATVAESAGAMGPAYVGLALVDSRGQWGAARRLDVLPDLGSGVLSQRDSDDDRPAQEQECVDADAVAPPPGCPDVPRLSDVLGCGGTSLECDAGSEARGRRGGFESPSWADDLR